LQKNLILHNTQKSRRTKRKKAEEQNTKKSEETEEKIGLQKIKTVSYTA